MVEARTPGAIAAARPLRRDDQGQILGPIKMRGGFLDVIVVTLRPVTGSPPMSYMKRLSGPRNRLSLPTKLGFSPSLWIVPMKKMKSQLLVCGAPVITNLRAAGRSPVIVQPFQR